MATTRDKPTNTQPIGKRDTSLDEMALEALKKGAEIVQDAHEDVPGLSRMKREDLRELTLRLGEQRDHLMQERDAGRREREGLEEELLQLRMDLEASKKREASALADAEQAQHEATHDPLTDLLNRKGASRAIERHLLYLSRRLEQLRIAGKEVPPPPPMAVILMDIDHFKSFNDNYGHDVGDTVLRMVGEVLRSALRGEDDFAVRWGGEEFIVVLPNPAPGLGYKVAERIRVLIEKLEITVGDKKVPITASLGVSKWQGAEHLGDEVEAIVDRKERMKIIDSALEQNVKFADEAMYKAKKEGRNRVWIYEGVEGVEKPLPSPGPKSELESVQ